MGDGGPWRLAAAVAQPQPRRDAGLLGTNVPYLDNLTLLPLLQLKEMQNFYPCLDCLPSLPSGESKTPWPSKP